MNKRESLGLKHGAKGSEKTTATGLTNPVESLRGTSTAIDALLTTYGATGPSHGHFQLNPKEKAFRLGILNGDRGKVTQFKRPN